MASELEPRWIYPSNTVIALNSVLRLTRLLIEAIPLGGAAVKAARFKLNHELEKYRETLASEAIFEISSLHAEYISKLYQNAEKYAGTLAYADALRNAKEAAELYRDRLAKMAKRL
jgi:hypothetical protein